MKTKRTAIIGMVTCFMMMATFTWALSANAATCAGSVPSGTVVVDIYTDSVNCRAAGPSNNAYQIASYLDKRIGDTMQMCAGFPVPSGWQIVDSYNNPTKCGGGNFINIAKIRRMH